MAAEKEEKKVSEDADPEDDLEDGPDSALFFVHQKTLEQVTKLLEDEKGDEITEKLVTRMLDVEGLEDEETLLAVDMSEANEYDDGEEMIKKLGAKAAGEVFVKARKKFLDGLEEMKKNGEDGEGYPSSLTVKQYKEQLAMEDAEEEDLVEDEEEDADAGEPAAKKAKTE
eukprot:TRINITY_DN56888_c0_g1_i1.p1 TRINITY_DN56888_c0_g1~~TRINITY_DN56888_c0_g1_i1.p1  ORF type:complete len:193 (-),score=78.33 TRINITY_DN56888_c0_g1_i1:157-666(-)